MLLPTCRRQSSGSKVSNGEQLKHRRGFACLPLTSCYAVWFLTNHRLVVVCGTGVGDPCSIRLWDFEDKISTSYFPSVFSDTLIISPVYQWTQAVSFILINAWWATSVALRRVRL